MRRQAKWCAAFALLLCACGSGDAPEETPQVNQGQRPLAQPPANVVGGFSIQLPEQILEPGDESFPCWIFPLEVTGPSRIVGGGKLATGPGMHHGNITTRPVTEGEGIRPCETGQGSDNGVVEADDILKGGSVLFGSSTQMEGEEWQSFPDGMGYRVVDGYEIVARMHYLNTTSDSLAVAPRYEWFTIDEAKVTHELGPFAWQMSGFSIPPLSTYTIKSQCRPVEPMFIVNAMPHMHALGTAFFGSYVGGPYDGQRWLDSRGYDPDNGVIVQYAPAIDASLGEGVEWGCTWTNTFDKTIVEGTGDNEMCILFGYAYPYDFAYSALALEGDHCVLVQPPKPGSGL